MKATLLALTMIVFTNLLFGQEKDTQRNYGLSASLQNNQMDISLPIWMGERSTLAPVVSLLYVEDGGKDIGVGIVHKLYSKVGKISPYFTERAGAFLLLPEHGDYTIDWMLGGGFGADYFFDECFSVGLEAQLNATISDKKSDRFGNPGGMNLNTATAIIASIYF